MEAIVDCIHQNRENGYIWHTTGSGKTLTSFKASTLLKTNPDIEKCLFTAFQVNWNIFAGMSDKKLLSLHCTISNMRKRGNSIWNFYFAVHA